MRNIEICSTLNIEKIEKDIEYAADCRDLTFAKNFNGKAYALMDLDWIGYFNSLEEICEFHALNIQPEPDNIQHMPRRRIKQLQLVFPQFPRLSKRKATHQTSCHVNHNLNLINRILSDRSLDTAYSRPGR